jgi:2-keto-4-pentenoate hydratase/2-oxohepta-3-ene-1,7-dioic acid hydratase in catechol pathway
MTRYIRYQEADSDGVHRYGRVQDGASGPVVQELERAPWDLPDGSPPDEPGEIDRTHPLDSVRLLAPCEPSKVIAVGRNFRSHLGSRPAPEVPGLFWKPPSSIIGTGEAIVLPPDARNVHPEGELVIVIGRIASRIAAAAAGDHIFGVTAGNDVSERGWQQADLQWFRAKGADTFGPLGPAIVTGLDYNDLLIESRLNGETRQSERSRDLLFPVDEIVSYVSRYVTLLPGDVVFTGTPGITSAMDDGDVVEVEIEGVGVLRNPVVRAGGWPATRRRGAGR